MSVVSNTMKVKAGNDQEMAQKEFLIPNTEMEKNLINTKVLILRKHIVKRYK